MFDPYNSKNGTEHATWRPEPSSRGTFSILSTCIITLGLCVWSALHLNIPEKGGARKQFWRKVGWLILGILAPELVAWTAFEQYREAKKLHAFVKKRRPFGTAEACSHSEKPIWRRLLQYCWRMSGPHNGPDHELNCRIRDVEDLEAYTPRNYALKRHPWTMTHSFYAVMGGFAFDTSDLEGNFLPGNRTRLTLNLSGLETILTYEPNLLPNISLEEIWEKSKANGLVKAIVCIQALWFCVQCVVRVAQGLSISLLELNTIAHALCAFAIYWLWWDKPLDVEEPTLIVGDQIRGICSYLCLRSKVGGKRQVVHESTCAVTDETLWIYPSDLIPTHITEKIEGMADRVDTDSPENADDQTGPNENPTTINITDPSQIDTAANQTPAKSAGIVVAQTEELQFTASMDRSESQAHHTSSAQGTELADASENLKLYAGMTMDGLFFLDVDPKKGCTCSPLCRYIQLTPDDKLCAIQALKFVEEHPTLRTRAFASRLWPSHTTLRDCLPKDLGDILPNPLRDRLRNWPSVDLDLELLDWNIFVSPCPGEKVLVGFCAVNALYGALHLSAWNAPFHTSQERILWRLSGITVAACVPAFILSVLLMALARTIGKQIGESVRSQRVRIIINYLMGLFIMLNVLWFGAMPLLYIFARVYLVVESIIMVAYLPDSAYKMPVWSAYIPHIA